MSDNTAPLINLSGKRVALGPLSVEHAPTIARWYADYETMRFWGYLPEPRSVDAVKTHFQPDGFFGKPTINAFAVYEIATWELIGMAGVFDISHVNRTAELFVMIGDAHYRGQGFGTEATRLTLDHAFHGIGLINVVLRVVTANVGGIRAYEKAGFTPIGVRRKSKLIGGVLHDSLYMEALADEFESPLLKEALLSESSS